jgi:phosphotransferase system HPr (HPr) family protein
MHARPAAFLAQTCVGLTSQITIRCGQKTANGSDVLQLLGLHATDGSILEITADGGDEDAALDELIAAGRSSADTEYRKSVYKNAMEIIMDWGCELPLYQRKDCTVASSVRVVTDTLPGDMTPYWGWYAEVETLAVK